MLLLLNYHHSFCNNGQAASYAPSKFASFHFLQFGFPISGSTLSHQAQHSQSPYCQIYDALMPEHSTQSPSYECVSWFGLDSKSTRFPTDLGEYLVSISNATDLFTDLPLVFIFRSASTTSRPLLNATASLAHFPSSTRNSFAKVGTVKRQLALSNDHDHVPIRRTTRLSYSRMSPQSWEYYASMVKIVTCS